MYGGEPVVDDRGLYAYARPFHGDRTKCAAVKTISNVFVCHSSDMKGTATQLIMKKENCSYGDALNRAEKASGPSNGNVPGAPSRGRGVSSRSGNRSGSRAFKRTWRSS